MMMIILGTVMISNGDFKIERARSASVIFRITKIISYQNFTTRNSSTTLLHLFLNCLTQFSNKINSEFRKEMKF